MMKTVGNVFCERVDLWANSLFRRLKRANSRRYVDRGIRSRGIEGHKVDGDDHRVRRIRKDSLVDVSGDVSVQEASIHLENARDTKSELLAIVGHIDSNPIGERGPPPRRLNDRRFCDRAVARHRRASHI